MLLVTSLNFMELDLHGHRRFKTNLTLQLNFFFRSVRADTLKNLYDCYSCENTRLKGISAVLHNQFIRIRKFNVLTRISQDYLVCVKTVHFRYIISGTVH